MLNNISAISNPTLYYALDPGEMGIAAPAKASESVLRVASHELGNIHRFEAEAMEKGGIVIYENIYLNRQFAGSFLAARSGESKAVIIYPRRQSKHSRAAGQAKEATTRQHGLTVKDRLKRLKDRLQREIACLETRLRNIENDPSQQQKADVIRKKIRNIKDALLRLQFAESRPQMMKNAGPLPALVGNGLDITA